MGDTFEPVPLFRSGHQQTVLGYLMRKWQRAMPATMHRLKLPDGDVLHLYDTKPADWHDNDPIVLIVHGLGGSHLSGSVLRLAWQCHQNRMRVVRINLRGSGESLSEARKPYHAGCSEDVRLALEYVRHWSPQSPLFLIGLSLGGNIVLKLAGETPQDAIPHLRKVISISPPVDLERCSQLLAQPHNAIYEKRFVRELTEMAQMRARLHGEEIPQFPKDLKLREFDDLYTAPKVGYSGVEDYYHRASSRHLFQNIEIPTHILSAEDDPMIDPVAIRESSRSAVVSVHLTRYGGHLGFISRPSRGGWCWLENYVVNQHLLPFVK